MAKPPYATKLILIVVLGLLLAFESRHVSATGEGDLMQKAGGDAEQVSETFSRYIEAYEKKDLETLGKIFANDDKLQAFWPDPTNPFRIEGWKEVRRGLEGYLPAITSMRVNIRQPIVQIYGPLAIMSCHWSFVGAVGGKPQVGSGRGTYVFEKRSGAWVLVHLHESSMPAVSK